MAPRSELVGTWNQTVGVKIDMDDAVRILTPSDVPLQQMLPTEGTVQTKIEWMEEGLLPQAVVNSAQSGTGPWTLTTTDTSELRVGDILAVRDGASSALQYLVDSVTNGTTYVVSGFAGNTTAPGATSTLEIVGQYVVEGADPKAPRSIERVAKYNYTQIAQESVQATRTARQRGAGGGLYGQGDPYEHELMKKYKELAIRFEKSIIHGQRAISGDSKQRFMGGLFYFINSNTASNTKANIKTLLNDVIRKAYDNGGTPDTIMVSPTVKSIISTLNDSINRTTRQDSGAGSTVDTFMSDFGEVRVVPNRHFPKTRGLALNIGGGDNCVVNFYPYTHELLAKTGDSDRGQIVAEKSLCAKNEAGEVVFTVTDA